MAGKAADVADGGGAEMGAANADQQDFWTAQAGPTWVSEMAAMDAALAPVLTGVLVRAALKPGERVLDIGCGAGTSTLEAAALTGANGHVCGADISDTLLEAARHRSAGVEGVSYLLCDAQSYDFKAEYDALISRFGVMFFDDFTAAFINMARALQPGGRMILATWGAIPENPFFTFPAGVAKAELGPTPKSDPDAPGPLALRDVDKGLGLLRAAGLADTAVEEVTLALTPSGSAQDVAELMCRIGPADRALSYFQSPPAERAAFVTTLADALQVYQTPEGIRIPALINFFTARKPT